MFSSSAWSVNGEVAAITPSFTLLAFVRAIHRCIILHFVLYHMPRTVRSIRICARRLYFFTAHAFFFHSFAISSYLNATCKMILHKNVIEWGRKWIGNLNSQRRVLVYTGNLHVCFSQRVIGKNNSMIIIIPYTIRIKRATKMAVLSSSDA